MPLFHIGYRRYEGERTSHALRWLPITRSGVTIAWRSKLLRRLVYVSFLPLLYFGWVFFIIGRITDPSSTSTGSFYEVAQAMLGPEVVRQLHEDPAAVRTAVWSAVFASFTTVFQLLMAGLVAAIVGPKLVATDMRSRAFLIYFARPLSRLDYVIGKTGILVVTMGAVTLGPSLCLYVFSILFSPSLDTLVQTGPVALSVVLSGLGMIVPAALLMLALSSLTLQPRFAAAAWIVICLFGPIVHQVLQNTPRLRDAGWTFLVSFPSTVRTLALGMYDVEGRTQDIGVRGDLETFAEGLSTTHSPGMAAAWLAGLSLVCVLFLLRRVDAPTRI